MSCFWTPLQITTFQRKYKPQNLLQCNLVKSGDGKPGKQIPQDPGLRTLFSLWEEHRHISKGHPKAALLSLMHSWWVLHICTNTSSVPGLTILYPGQQWQKGCAPCAPGRCSQQSPPLPHTPQSTARPSLTACCSHSCSPHLPFSHNLCFKFQVW